MENTIENILYTVVVGAATYVFLIFILRISGKRTLSKMNAFDFIVTVAFGSTLASTMLSRSTSIYQGMAALALLVVLQLVITWLTARWDFMQKIIKATPALIFYQGEFLEEEMKRVRVARSEVLAAMRESGVGSYQEVEAVVLETNGELSVIQKISESSSTLENVIKPFEQRSR